jgi:desulfoferrodoxin (superoxide reductase-like protein)
MGEQKSQAEDLPRKQIFQSRPDASATVIKNKHLPRINTELHGRKQKRKIRPGNITHLSEPDA